MRSTTQKAVYTVFEVLNSRGLDVSWLDRLKSILMGAAFELKNANQKTLTKDLHTIWRDIYTVIGLRQGLSTEALRFAATLKVADARSRPLSEEDSVELIRGLAINAKTIRDAAAWLLRVTQACDTMLANARLDAVTGIAQARLLAIAINLRHDIREKDRDKLLRSWEKISFRIYGMLGNDKRFRVGDYVRLAWETVNNGQLWQKIDATLKEIGADFPIKTAVDALRNDNCYEGWEGELRYFMFRYEEHLAKIQGLNFKNEQWQKIWMVSPSESIEHIWAQSKSPKRQQHRLGNLVLLPPKLNSKLQDLDPKKPTNNCRVKLGSPGKGQVPSGCLSASKKKVAAYRKTGLLIAGEVADMIDSGKWNKQSIDERENRMLAWAETEWAD